MFSFCSICSVSTLIHVSSMCCYVLINYAPIKVSRQVGIVLGILNRRGTCHMRFFYLETQAIDGATLVFREASY